MSENAPNQILTELESRDPRLPQPKRIAEQMWPEGTIPFVSICSAAYNHEKFVRECLDGFLMQETTFPVEILIHDDASTDNTATIIREYEARYPHTIKPIYQTENQYRKGKAVLPILFARAKGKYIALCEGDDYWTEPSKLQIQVDFMELHPNYSGCFHNVNILYEDGSKKTHPRFVEPLKGTFTIEDVAVAHCIPTLSNLFRTRLFPKFPEWCLRMPVLDWPLHVLNAEHGDIGYIDQILGVYRVHEGGVWSSLSNTEDCKRCIQVAQAIDEHLGFKYTRAIRKKIAWWHYRIAMNMSREGIDNGILGHLRSSMRNSFFHDEISKKAMFAVYIKYSYPVLYKWLRLVQKALRDRGNS